MAGQAHRFSREIERWLRIRPVSSTYTINPAAGVAMPNWGLGAAETKQQLPHKQTKVVPRTRVIRAAPLPPLKYQIRM
jgi:hypothetical protein